MSNIRWRKSTYSGTHQCLEVGRVTDGVAVRDTKNRASGHFTTTDRQWTAFVDALKVGRFDR